jgi:hypothetical protein
MAYRKRKLAKAMREAANVVLSLPEESVIAIDTAGDRIAIHLRADKFPTERDDICFLEMNGKRFTYAFDPSPLCQVFALFDEELTLVK